LYTSRTRELFNTKTEGKQKMVNPHKQTQVKLMKGLLDLIVLQFLHTQPMHGYQIITKIRKSFGVYFGPSTIYPLLATLEKKGYVNSQWNMNTERPRKTYQLTNEGQNLLNFTEDSLSLICRKISISTNTEMKVATSDRDTFNPMLKRVRPQKHII
jgi:PadR family transcriptional regulator PadR